MSERPSRKSASDPASERVARAQAREAAGWPEPLVSALNILEYGCDDGDFDEEALAVANAIEAAREVVHFCDAEGFGNVRSDFTVRLDAMRRAVGDA